MHIAVCDDNIGDRKQLERLLERESAKHAPTSGVFYIDSYGSIDAVLQSPMLYNVFFIDMVSGDTDGAALARLLLKAGVTAPIVLCVSSIDYRKAFGTEKETENQRILFIDKPIIRTELSALLDHIITLQSEVIPTIELRGEKETCYVKEDDIVYAKADDRYVNIYLKDGRILRILSTLDNFYAQIASFSHYAAVTRNSMINVTFLQHVSFTKITLTDGSVLRTTPSYASDIKKALQQFAKEQ